MNLKKCLFFFVLLALLMLFSCGEANIPQNLKVVEGVLSFDNIENANNYVASISDEQSNVFKYDITNNFDLTFLDLALGKYKIKVKSVINDKESDYSQEIEYTQKIKKIFAPTNLKYENKKFTWNEVNGAVEYELKFKTGEKEIIKKASIGINIDSLSIEADTYEVSVRGIGNDVEYKDSDFSNTIEVELALAKLATPSGIIISETTIYFNQRPNVSSYIIKFINESNEEKEFTVLNGMNINELNMPIGNYKIALKACGDKIVTEDSDYTDLIDYEQKEISMLLSESELTNGKYVKWMGRTSYNTDNKEVTVYHSASGFEVFFRGEKAQAVITATNYSSTENQPYIVITIDDDFTNARTIILNQKETIVTLIENSDGKEHKLDLYKRSESIDSHIGIKSLKAYGEFIAKVVNKEHKIEFIAASSSTGYGNLSTATQSTANSDALRAFAFLTSQALNADVNIYSASGWGCKASLWTTPQTLNMFDAYKKVDMYSQETWIYGKYVPDLVVINLGTNDWSYIKAGTTQAEKDARMTAFQRQYIEFLKYLHQIYPDAQIIVLYGLMNEQEIYEATELIVNNAKSYVPNIKSIKINGDAKGSNSHPSLESHKQISDTLTAFIKSVMGW